MGKKPPVDEEPEGAPEWIVTFSDMISLLVTFFILLMTFSSLDDNEEFLDPSSNIGTAGTRESEGGRSLTNPPENDIMSEIDIERGADIPHARDMNRLDDDLDNVGQKLTEDHTEINLNDVIDGLVIRFDERSSFRPGSAEVEPALHTALAELGRVLEHYPFLVVVEGFTDSEAKPTPRYPNAQALGSARAVAAAEVMLATSGLSPKRVQVAGLGEERPRRPNDTPVGRAANRRVEIRILSLSKTVATHLKRTKQGAR